MTSETEHSTGAQRQRRDFARWCVMDHARPALLDALNAWGLREESALIAASDTPGALRTALPDVHRRVAAKLRLAPSRRSLLRALSLLQVAATFAGRGDAENTSAMAIGVFGASATALAWRRPWTLFRAGRRAQQASQAARAAQLARWPGK
ncbi:MAG: hypothetical protein IT323_04885 [Anaerolineae bacterium]|nr:hypothetical protein [Anaerolineae bacterium]